MEILGQLVEKQAPNWDLWSRHFARYRQKKKLQLQLNNHGCRTDKYQQTFFPFAHVMILANLSLVCFNSELVQIWAETKNNHDYVTLCFNSELVQIWAETKKTAMTMLHYWQFARLNLFNSSRLYDPRVNLEWNAYFSLSYNWTHICNDEWRV